MNAAIIFILAAAAFTSSADAACEEVFKCVDHKVNELVNDQIGVELKGHYTYLYLSQIFDQHSKHYPQVTKYLRAKSSEELSHAERFIQYQNQRGGTVSMPNVQRYTDGACGAVDSITKALKCAMELEAHVTSKLTQLYNDVENIEHTGACSVDTIESGDLRLTQPVLVKCTRTGGTELTTLSSIDSCICSTIESVAYVELAEMIAHEFLGHQVEDTKEIANLYFTIKKMTDDASSARLADFLFDKHLHV